MWGFRSSSRKIFCLVKSFSIYVSKRTFCQPRFKPPVKTHLICRLGYKMCYHFLAFLQRSQDACKLLLQFGGAEFRHIRDQRPFSLLKFHAQLASLFLLAARVFTALSSLCCVSSLKRQLCFCRIVS